MVVDTQNNEASVNSSPPSQSQGSDIDELGLGDESSGESALDRKNTLLFRIGIAAAIGIVLTVGVVGVAFVRSLSAPKEPPVAMVFTPPPTPTPAFTKADIAFEVLNGSGVGGAAAKAAEIVSLAGYTVMRVGNGPKTTGNKLFLGGKAKEHEATILADLSELVSSVSGDLTDSTASARIIIGK